MKIIKWIFGGSYIFYRDMTNEYESILDQMLYKDTITIDDVANMNKRIYEFAARFQERSSEVPELFFEHTHNDYREAITSLKKAYNRYLDMV